MKKLLTFILCLWLSLYHTPVFAAIIQFRQYNEKSGSQIWYTTLNIGGGDFCYIGSKRFVIKAANSLSFLMFAVHSKSLKIEASGISAPAYSYFSAVTFNGKNLLAVDFNSVDGAMYLDHIDLESGAILGTPIPLPATGGVPYSSICFDGKDIWGVYQSGEVGVLDKLNQETGALLKSMNINTNNVKGIAFDGKHLLVLDGTNLQFINPKTTTGTAVKNFIVSGGVAVEVDRESNQQADFDCINFYIRVTASSVPPSPL